MKFFKATYSIKDISTFAPIFVYIKAESEEEAKKIAPENIVKFGSYCNNIENIEKIWIDEITKPKIAFISGHLDLTDEEFNEFYIPQIEKSINQGHFFVVGDAMGADTMAQKLLANYNSVYVEVYHMLDYPRNNDNKFNTIGGFKSDNERDTAMTKNSDYDIAWIRPGKEESGTAKNIARRNKDVSKK